MPQYYVQVPATMAIGMTIEAEDEEAAKEAVFNVDFSLSLTAGATETAGPELLEFELHEYVTKGNMYSAVLNEIHIEEVDEGTDEEEDEE